MIRALVLALVLLSAAPVHGADGWSALAQPGSIGLMRHAEAPGTGDPDEFRLGNCATQRVLSDAGRAQARAVGEAIRRHGIKIDRVLTSQWCRCQETANLLAVAPVEPLAALNSLRWKHADKAAQTAEVTRLVMQPGGKLILVTHQFNITELTGLPAASGEIVVVGPREGGGIEVRGRIPP